VQSYFEIRYLWPIDPDVLIGENVEVGVERSAPSNTLVALEQQLRRLFRAVAIDDRSDEGIDDRALDAHFRARPCGIRPNIGGANQRRIV
jgi:hypothetical protein